MAAAEWLVRFLLGYAAVGLLFALSFVFGGVSRIDPEAKGAGLGFRLMILPGVATLWPVVLVRWAGALRRDSTAA